MIVHLAIQVPDTLATIMESPGLEHTMLEAFAADGYRTGKLTKKQVSQLLGHTSRWETEDFLTAHDALRSVSLEDVTEGAAALRTVLGCA
jgi:hypothetical protein